MLRATWSSAHHNPQGDPQHGAHSVRDGAAGDYGELDFLRTTAVPTFQSSPSRTGFLVPSAERQKLANKTVIPALVHNMAGAQHSPGAASRTWRSIVHPPGCLYAAT